MYETLAAYYDKFSQGTPSDVGSIARELGARRKGCDVGCGTGKLAVALWKLGYDVTGCDASPEMLNVARERARAEGARVEFVLQSAQKFASPHKLDFITAICDVVNYLPRPEEFFARAYAALNVGGVLIFDVSTPYKLKNVLAGNTFTDTADDVTYIWENALGRGGRYVDMYLAFFIPDGSGRYVKRTETQRQYAHDPAALTEALGRVGFSRTETRGEKGKRPRANEQRITIIAHKEHHG